MEGESLVFTVRNSFDLLMNGAILKNGRGTGIRIAPSEIQNAHTSESESSQVGANEPFGADLVESASTGIKYSNDNHLQKKCAISVQRDGAGILTRCPEWWDYLPASMRRVIEDWDTLPPGIRAAFEGLAESLEPDLQ